MFGRVEGGGLRREYELDFMSLCCFIMLDVEAPEPWVILTGLPVLEGIVDNWNTWKVRRNYRRVMDEWEYSTAFEWA